MRLLNKIDDPNDLKLLPLDCLPELAQEIRDWIIEVVSETGGHLAAGLGAVELTIALHYVFDPPRDKIIWDVGHQAYPHKLLTGRRDRFHTLRQYGGISGFCSREESVFDTLGAGHGGTSLSAAGGMAAARELKGEHHKIVPIIGDGALTAGLALEGLNYAGSMKKDFIVVLNDNEMSISENVGALSLYLSRLFQGTYFTRLRDESMQLIKHVPGFGGQLYKIAKRVEGTIKAMDTPGIIFEELGYTYVGPIDGHDVYHVIDALRFAATVPTPALVHVITKKGKGYHPAEGDPIAFHGVGPFDKVSGRKAAQSGSAAPSYTKVFAETLCKLAAEDPKIVGITAAMPEGTGLNIFARKFPQRFFDVGMAEQHAVEFAVGLALEGMRPVAAIYSTFLQRAFDQIIHDAGVMNAPITLAIDRAGLVGEDGPTHHGVFDYAYLRIVPNYVVMAPMDEEELRHMLKTAVEHPGPAAVRFPRGSGVGVALSDEIRTLPIGRGEVLREGAHGALLAIGSMVHPALQAAEKLGRFGLRLTVANMRFVKPLDGELIEQITRQVPVLITLEEHMLMGGFGSAVLEELETRKIEGVRVHRIGLPDRLVTHGSASQLRKLCGLDTEGVFQTLCRLFDIRAGESAGKIVTL